MSKFLSRRPWATLSVRQTLVLGAGLSILLPALLWGYFQIANRLEKDIELRVKIPMQQYADVLARGVAVAIWNLDRGVATELVDAVMRNPDVARVTVSDEYKEVFVKRQVEGVEESDILREERVVTYSGKRVGHLVVEMTTTRVKREFLVDLSKLGMASLMQVVISFIFILVLLERRMIRPLRDLQSGTVRMASGDLDRPFHWFRQDEFGHLANGLDSMRQNLAALLSEREQKNKELEYELQERKRTEAALVFSQAKFAAIFDGSPVAMTVSHIGGEYRVRDLNGAWERMFHRSRAEIVDSSGTSNGVWRNQADRDAMLARLTQSGYITDTEVWMCRGDALADILVAITGCTIMLDGESMLILAYEDVTEKRRIEEEIRALNSTLELRVQERTLELTEALERLQATQSELVRSEKLSALGSLVAGVAHELNTPIGNSLTVASTMLDQTREFSQTMASGLTRSKLENYVANTNEGTGILMRSLRHAADLVASFKQVAVDQTSVNRRRFDLHDTVEEILLTLGPSIRKTQHTVQSQIASNLSMESYPGPLGQVLTNLINNAMVHAFDGIAHGVVTISAQLQGDSHVKIMVQDNGIGIPTANLERVFDPFFTTKLGRGGSGLGLNIVYNLVREALGGTVTVASAPGQGACFTLILPLRAPVVDPVGA
ncbi:MAG: HAMP domain-containing protein [Limnohabitans sp.]|nr:MAG: HAMP domain-containing protein [Limnohabitans sp.]